MKRQRVCSAKWEYFENVDKNNKNLGEKNMGIVLEEAKKEDISELIRLRIAYMVDDFGQVSDYESKCIEKQLLYYFERKLGTELIAFVAKDGKKIVSVAYLHIIEMPANSVLLNGLYGEVLSVYTEPDYRGRGLCSQLIQKLIQYGKKIGLGKINLSATNQGYPIYKKAGFVEKEHRYTDMIYRY